MNKKIIIGFALALAVTTSCGSSSSGISFPKSYQGTFKVRMDVEGAWGRHGRCSQEITTGDATLYLDKSGSLNFTAPNFDWSFWLNAQGECQNLSMAYMITKTVYSGTHDSNGNLQFPASFVAMDGAGAITSDFSWKNTGTYKSGEATFSGTGQGSGGRSGWNYIVVITYSFSGKPA